MTTSTSVVKKSLESMATCLAKQHTTHETHLQTVLASAKAAGKEVVFTQSNFANGQINITKTGYLYTNASGNTEFVTIAGGGTDGYVFRLGSDIVFDANAPLTNDADGVWNSGFLTPAQFAAGYDHMANGLGFFTALSISASNIVLDMDGYSISQSPRMQLLQRFWSCIELASSPFVPSQGPFSFASRIESASNIAIVNGILSSSAHHSIHGNNNSDIFLKGLKCTQYEVGAFALNGAKNISIVDCQLDTANNRIPTLGTWSASLFIRPFGNQRC